MGQNPKFFEKFDLKVPLSVQWILGGKSFQKLYGLYGFKYHKVEKRLVVTIVTNTLTE